MGNFWRSFYEVNDFAKVVDELWNEIKPLYVQLHAYVRYRLHLKYGDRVSSTGPLPAHLLGEFIWFMTGLIGVNFVLRCQSH